RLVGVDPGDLEGEMSTATERRSKADRDDRFFGDALPLELGARGAVRAYLRRFITLVLLALGIVLLAVLIVVAGPIGAGSIMAALLILFGMASLRGRRREGLNRPVSKSHRISAAIVFGLLPIGIAFSAGYAVVHPGGLRIEFTLLAITMSLGMAYFG